MGVITKVVDRIHEPEKYEQYLQILGQKHLFYDVQKEYMHIMGTMYLAVIRPMLEREVKSCEQRIYGASARFGANCRLS